MESYMIVAYKARSTKSTRWINRHLSGSTALEPFAASTPAAPGASSIPTIHGSEGIHNIVALSFSTTLSTYGSFHSMVGIHQPCVLYESAVPLWPSPGAVNHLRNALLSEVAVVDKQYWSMRPRKQKIRKITKVMHAYFHEVHNIQRLAVHDLLDRLEGEVRDWPDTQASKPLLL